MSVKIPVPCSIYDIRGIQEWLDEMARQGLFLKKVNRRFDRAEFEVGDPAPVRYRLDPVVWRRKENEEHVALYAQMGWNYVDRVPRWYYIFSCNDPEAPELYSDPQSLSLALNHMIRRNVRNSLLVILFALAVLPFVLFFPTAAYNFQNLLLWERPRDVFFMVSYPILLVLCLPLLAFESRRIRNIRDTLAQGMPLKAGKRMNRPPWYVVWALIYIPIYVLPRLLFPNVGWDVCGLEERVPAHPWPTAAQVEAVGTHPLTEEPVTDGYIRYNDSPFAPVQEEVNRHRVLDPDDPTDTDLHTTVRYVQAGSPKIAQWLYQMERDREAKSLKDRQSTRYTYQVTNLVPFASRDWIGLDRLEIASYQWRDQDSWTFAALRGNDVLLVDYTGAARWEDCLPLFLEALDKEATT